jgi:isopentenyl-diphosphate delta-isomerase
MNTHKTYLESEVYRAVFQNGLTEYEYDHVFVGTYDGTFEPNPEEISELRYVPLTELKQDMLTHPERYAVWFFTALRIAEEWYSEIEVTAGQ